MIMFDIRRLGFAFGAAAIVLAGLTVEATARTRGDLIFCRLQRSDDLADCRKYYDREDPRYETCVEAAHADYRACVGGSIESLPPDLDLWLKDIFNRDEEYSS